MRNQSWGIKNLIIHRFIILINIPIFIQNSINILMIYWLNIYCASFINYKLLENWTCFLDKILNINNKLINRIIFIFQKTYQKISRNRSFWLNIYRFFVLKDTQRWDCFVRYNTSYWNSKHVILYTSRRKFNFVKAQGDDLFAEQQYSLVSARVSPAALMQLHRDCGHVHVLSTLYCLTQIESSDSGTRGFPSPCQADSL